VRIPMKPARQYEAGHRLNEPAASAQQETSLR